MLGNKKIRIIVIIIISFNLIFYNSLFANETQLSNFIITNKDGYLILYFKVEGAFKEKMKKAVLSGVPITFSFLIKFKKLNSFWIDKNIADIKITNTIKYNAIKNEFTIIRSLENDTPIVTSSFNEAQKFTSEIDCLKVTLIDNLIKDSSYRIKAKAELNKLTLPFYLHYILFFISLWDFETNWYYVDFKY